MILSRTAIRNRLENGEIFVPGTWDEGCIKEASYTLRVARDGMHINGKAYSPGKDFPQETISIEPGNIGFLSTVERFHMPKDLVGHQGIRFNYAARGLTGLMGIQVDPLYGDGMDNERLYLRFANLSNDAVLIIPGEAIFNIEFQTVEGEVEIEAIEAQHGRRPPMWTRVLEQIADQRDPGWSFTTSVKQEVERVEKVFQPLVTFGVFLVATTLLGVSLAILLSVRDNNIGNIPDWVGGWAWALLLAELSFAALVATVTVGIAVTRLVNRK
jgi:deoxycytidine triphosphate deaminase